MATVEVLAGVHLLVLRQVVLLGHCAGDLLGHVVLVDVPAEVARPELAGTEDAHEHAHRVARDGDVAVAEVLRELRFNVR